jgi:hypothetical protein
MLKPHGLAEGRRKNRASSTAPRTLVRPDAGRAAPIFRRPNGSDPGGTAASQALFDCVPL